MQIDKRILKVIVELLLVVDLPFLLFCQQEPDLFLKRRPPLYAILLLLLHVLTGHVSRII